jgi:transforming growth factor-beta-induced protein
LFAPTNTAFEALAADTLGLLTSEAGAEMLTDILTYHVISGSLTSDLVQNGFLVQTVQGGIVTFSVGQSVMVNDATVVQADMLAFNGVTHGIDRILMPPWTTIVDVAVATAFLSTLVTAVTTAGLVDALNDPAATLTVFGPTNGAFSALPEGFFGALLTRGFRKHLQAILLYHVFSVDAVLSTELAATQDIEMFNGEMLTVTKTDTAVTVTTTKGQTANVVMKDVEGSNGVLHVIDGVLSPSSIGATVIDMRANYSTLLSLITNAGLEENLKSRVFTLFAPTNTAFKALPAENLAFLSSDDGAEDLANILMYHVISGSVTSDMVQNGFRIPTEQGGIVTFRVDIYTVMVNGATVVEADMLAFNGVTHGIDRILIPPVVESMAPTMAPASGGLALGASLSALFAAVLAVAL